MAGFGFVMGLPRPDVSGLAMTGKAMSGSIQLTLICVAVVISVL